MSLKDHTQRECLISYHHDAGSEDQQFIEKFGHDRNLLIARNIGASGSGHNSSDNIMSEFRMSEIREKHRGDTTAIVVLLGRCMSARKFIDWEITDSLHNTSPCNRNGKGYTGWWTYPSYSSALVNVTEIAYTHRSDRSHLVTNHRVIRMINSVCP